MVDQDKLRAARQAMSRIRRDTTSRNGAVRVVYVNPDAPPITRAAKLDMITAHEYGRAVDRDTRRGGFSTAMRHAR